MMLSLTFVLLLWFFSPALPSRFKFWGKVLVAFIMAYELSRIVYHRLFGLT